MLRMQRPQAKLIALNIPARLLAIATLAATLSACGGAATTGPTGGSSTTNAPVSGTQTVIEVDETGTVAAGTTGVGIGIGAIESPQFTMTINHPFFYAIQDSTTGVLLFIGVLMNPVQPPGSG